ncbi:MAG: M48 family metallopeptidase [Thermofilum sp.]|uniref:M48 family metallopeptidase n=1 Tax=Thermofilum sp. TaxID=1961369 RepID=UPI0031652BFC
MATVTVFGKRFTVVEEKSDRDQVRLKGSRIHVATATRPPNLLLKEFLEDLLYSQLVKIYDRMGRKVEVLGNLDFEIVDRIDRNKHRVAKIRRNRVLVKLNAVALPKTALRYVVAHEIAHVLTKRHTERFWRTVELICPDFKKGRILLEKHSNFITGDLIRQD